jgi:hypothetical protein
MIVAAPHDGARQEQPRGAERRVLVILFVLLPASLISMLSEEAREILSLVISFIIAVLITLAIHVLLKRWESTHTPEETVELRNMENMDSKF